MVFLLWYDVLMMGQMNSLIQFKIDF